MSGHAQLLLTLAAVSLFGLTVLNTNRNMVEQNEDRFRTEFEYYAVSLGQSFIEEAKTRAFDENTINSTPANLPNDFTSPSDLGPDVLSSGNDESYVTHTLDDVDDFNTYVGVDTSGHEKFTVSIGVGYVEASNPDSLVNYETFIKRMAVTVDNKYLNSPVVVAYLFGYDEN